MASMSIRGLNEKVLSGLKRRAAHEGTSLNNLDVAHGRAFEHDTAAFSEVDPALWK
jgi:plasmid stability protein